ncbi:cell growth-regulating nucleolar protein [Bombina bombina]|uniref:cell growth-regulating nucleolar protein n=1 Tax=Bombina bombina TaxID=8345 RepID=UPI00235ABA68|nr:cell growth-regulating nucleolar protein [Bombina bombina]
MVFFTCNGCGESLKKGQVEKHVAICRNCQCLSCIDCGKDFWGDDYKEHLKCISEDQKYGGKAFEAKANKGDVKQQQWIQRIQVVMEKPGISAKIKSILNQISSYDNVPRKKAKFQNWMKNSLKIQNQALQDQVWEIFSEATSNAVGTQDNQNQAEVIPPENKTRPSEAVEEINNKKKNKRERKEERQKQNKKEKKELHSEEQLEEDGNKKSKKRKIQDKDVTENIDDAKQKNKKKPDNESDHEENDLAVNSDHEYDAPIYGKKRKQKEETDVIDSEENSADENKKSNIGGKFNWKGTIKAVLRNDPDHELPIKRLRKKVIAQYYAVSSVQHKSEEELLATFNKKIRNNPKFKVFKDRVKLLK